MQREYRGLVLLATLVVLVSVGSGLTVKGQEAPSLYDRLGGLAPIAVVVSDFLDAVVPDPILNQNPAVDASRARVPSAYLKYHVTAMVYQATGGPCQYHGREHG